MAINPGMPIDKLRAQAVETINDAIRDFKSLGFVAHQNGVEFFGHVVSAESCTDPDGIKVVVCVNGQEIHLWGSDVATSIIMVGDKTTGCWRSVEIEVQHPFTLAIDIQSTRLRHELAQEMGAQEDRAILGALKSGE